MANHTLPTSEWKHSHAIETGDELIATDGGIHGRVKCVRDDGSVCVEWADGEQYHSEEGMRVALRDGVIKRSDGRSHELATY